MLAAEHTMQSCVGTRYTRSLLEVALAHPCARGIRASCSSENAQATKYGAGETIRCKRLHGGDVHTLLRLPTALCHAQAVTANVIFFKRKPASETPWTKQLWICDLRSNRHFALKSKPMEREDLDEFVKLYNPEDRHKRKATLAEGSQEGRWRVYRYEEWLERDKARLDIFWLEDDSLAESDNLPAPEAIALEIAEDLEAAVEQYRLITSDTGEKAEG